MLRLSDGTHAMMLYTSKSHPDLPDNFGGGLFKDALAAALKMPALDWVILSNRASQWVAIRKGEIPAILDDLRSKKENGHLTTLDGGSEDGMLEKLITRAVHCAPEKISPPIISVLKGRELFLELTAGQSEAGEPAMKIFRVNDMSNVVRAYLTRNRPGVTYGAIRWDALKALIKDEPGIHGVQIVNDADDWVVFDRESLGFGAHNELQ